MKSRLDWSAYENYGIGDAYAGIPARGGAYARAVAVCIGNRQCQRPGGKGVMCPSFRVTGDPAHSTQARVAALKAALNGEFGGSAADDPERIPFDDPRLAQAMELCVGCKGCKRECPNGVDMALLRTEWLAQRNALQGVARRNALFAEAPSLLARRPWLGWLVRLRNRVPLLARLGERWLGVSAGRSIPEPVARPLAARWGPAGPEAEADDAPARDGREVFLLVDSFSRGFEPEIAEAALEVLQVAGYRVRVLAPAAGDAEAGRALCCGRTYLSFGMVDEARAEARRMMAALAPALETGTPVVGLEPSCLLMLRDEYFSLGLGPEVVRLAQQSFLFEEFLAREHAAGRLALALEPVGGGRALVHGHCHQKAFGAMKSVKKVLALIPEFEFEFIESSCCGGAGSFGLEAEHHAASQAMAEQSLLPAVRGAAPDAPILADGFSCRHQIRDGSGRKAVHVAVLLREALAGRRRGGNPAQSG